MCSDEDRDKPTYDEIAAYFSGRLGSTERAKIATYLLRNPQAAQDAKEMFKIESELHDLGKKLLDEPLPEKIQKLLNKLRKGD